MSLDNILAQFEHNNGRSPNAVGARFHVSSSVFSTPHVTHLSEPERFFLTKVILSPHKISYSGSHMPRHLTSEAKLLGIGNSNLTMGPMIGKKGLHSQGSPRFLGRKDVRRSQEWPTWGHN